MSDMTPELMALLEPGDRGAYTVHTNTPGADSAFILETLRKLAESLQELADWRQGAEDVAAEECPETDGRKHCTCVAPLRAKLAEAWLEIKALADANALLSSVEAERDTAIRSLYAATARLTATEAERDALRAKLAVALGGMRDTTKFCSYLLDEDYTAIDHNDLRVILGATDDTLRKIKEMGDAD